MQNRPVDYVDKINPRSRRLRLAVYADGRLVVTRPRFLSERAALNFIRAKAAWIISRLEYCKLHPVPLMAGPGRRPEYLAQKEAARTFILARLAHFNEFYKFTYKRVSIRNQSTRWGSCSRQGNLNFNYRLLSLPPEVADYVIVHELCHLQELNHSARFWRLVAQTVPDYDEKRRKLRNKNSDL